MLQALRCERVQLARRFGSTALHTEAGRINRINADIRAIGGANDGRKFHLNRWWKCQTLGKEDDCLSTWEVAHWIDNGQQRVNRGKPLLIALEHLELFEDVRFHLDELLLGRRLA